MQQRHHEIAPTLGLGDIDLELEVETPEGQRAVAIADQIVEWRQQGGPRLELAGLDPLEQGDVCSMHVRIALEPEVNRNDRALVFQLLPCCGKSLITAPEEMLRHLLLGGHPERAQRADRSLAKGDR